MALDIECFLGLSLLNNMRSEPRGPAYASNLFVPPSVGSNMEHELNQNNVNLPDCLYRSRATRPFHVSIGVKVV
jgi:hypothetical protein